MEKLYCRANKRVVAKYFELYFAIHHQWLIMTRGEKEEVIKGERERGKHREREIQSKEEREKPIGARIEAQLIQVTQKGLVPPTPLIFRIGGRWRGVAWRGVAWRGVA